MVAPAVRPPTSRRSATEQKARAGTGALGAKPCSKHSEFSPNVPNAPNGDSRKAHQERQGVAHQLMGAWVNQSKAAHPSVAYTPMARPIQPS